MRRIVAMLLLVVMVLSLAACGGDTTPTQGNAGNTGDNGNQGGQTVQTVGNFTVPEGGYDGSEVTIRFYNTMGANLRAVLDLYIVEFNKLYPTKGYNLLWNSVVRYGIVSYGKIR